MAFGEEGSLSRWKELRGAKNPAWFKSPQPCAPRSVHFGVCRVVGGESAEILAYGLCYDPVWVPGRWESRSGGGGGGFPRSGNSPPALRGSPSPKVWRALWDAVCSRLGPRRRCRDAGAPLTPAEPPPPGGRIRFSGGQRPARAASAPSWGRALNSAHSASPVSARREARPGRSPLCAGSGARRAVS